MYGNRNLYEAGFSSLGKYGTRYCGSGVIAPQMVLERLNENADAIQYVPLCVSKDGCIQNYNSNYTGKEQHECQRMVRQRTFQDN